MVEFAKAEDAKLDLVELKEDGTYTCRQTTYYFDSNEKEVSLKSILLNDKKNPVEIAFNKPLPIISEAHDVVEGKFSVATNPVMGTIHGEYQWKMEKGICSISISPDDGWTSVPNSFITKMILSQKSIFCTWPKTYRYTQQIELSSLKSKSEWVRI